MRARNPLSPESRSLPPPPGGFSLCRSNIARTIWNRSYTCVLVCQDICPSLFRSSESTSLRSNLGAWPGTGAMKSTTIPRDPGPRFEESRRGERAFLAKIATHAVMVVDGVILARIRNRRASVLKPHVSQYSSCGDEL